MHMNFFRLDVQQWAVANMLVVVVSLSDEVASRFDLVGFV
jgi:hypothetical protein